MIPVFDTFRVHHGRYTAKRGWYCNSDRVDCLRILLCVCVCVCVCVGWSHSTVSGMVPSSE